MDKLRPVLEQKYWIFFGLALILPAWAWRSHTTEVAAQTASRQSTVAGLKNSIPNAATSPGPAWVEEGAKQNAEQKARIYEAAATLYATQQKERTWPSELVAVANEEDGRSFNDRKYRALYKNTYDRQIDELYRVLDPFNERTSAGKIVAARETIPQVKELGDFPPKEVVLESQEDIWLTRSLLEAIARVNADAQNLVDSNVRQLVSLTLFGATAAPKTEEKKKGGFSARGESDGRRGDPEEDQPLEAGTLAAEANKARGGGKAPQRKSPKVSVDLDQAVGGQVAAILGAGVERAGAASSDDSEDGRLFDGLAKSAGRRGRTGSRGSTSEPAVPNGAARYVLPQSNLPYKERGFELIVMIEHSEMPEMLSELTKMPWPVRFRRVHWKATENLDQPNAILGVPGGTRSRRGDDEGPVSGLPGAPETADPAANGKALRMAALADQDLIQLIVVGTMTIYDKPSDKLKPADAEKSAEQTAEAKAAADASAEAESSEEGEAAAEAADGAAAEEAAPASETPATDGEAPATEAETPAVEDAAPADASGEATPAAEPEPVEGEAPAEGEAAPTSTEEAGEPAPEAPAADAPPAEESPTDTESEPAIDERP